MNRRRQNRRRKARKTASRNQKVHYFKRTIYFPNWVNTIPLSTTTFVINPQLDDLPDHDDLTNLFDQYKITGVSFKLVPQWDSTQSQPAGVVPPPPKEVMSCIDYTSSGPTTTLEIQQYESLKVTRSSATHQRYFKPAIATEVYKNTISTAYAPKWNTFIDCKYPEVPHYGLYGVIPPAGMTYRYDMYATYYIAMRDVK